MWKTIAYEPPLTRSVIDNGPVRITIDESVEGGKNWQHLQLSFGQFSDSEHADCLKTWPLEAIRIARQKLIEFESEVAKHGLSRT